MDWLRFFFGNFLAGRYPTPSPRSIAIIGLAGKDARPVGEGHPCGVRARAGVCVGAAIVGLILYATFASTTGIIIGYVSLAVGWMVGKAIMQGSGGVGGRRYQVTAAVLTYAAASMAAAPVWIHYASQQRQQQQAHRQQTQQPQAQRRQLAEEQRQLEKEFGQQKPLRKGTPGNGDAPAGTSVEPAPQPTLEDETPPSAQGPEKQRMSRGEAIMKLALLGIASPIIEVWEGGPSFGWMIGLIILFVGIKIAWIITAGQALGVLMRLMPGQGFGAQ